MTEMINGDCLVELRKMAKESIHCCITSPPYWCLRDYGTAKWEGGDEKCDHKGKPMATHHKLHEGQPKDEFNREFFKEICGNCGAKRIDSQLGLEKTPEEYVSHMVGVFSEVRRVLKDEGTLWLNLGDSYNGSGGAGYQFGDPKKPRIAHFNNPNCKYDGLKPKNLVGIPWRVAFALQSDGWYLRQDIIWHKPNPMPESVTDRCTKSHEYIFLMAKSQKYYFDNEAIKELANTKPHPRGRILKNDNTGMNSSQNVSDITRLFGADGKRNKRSVWTVSTKPFKEAHFATFPEDLVRPMILAGCPEFVCKKCGKAKKKILDHKLIDTEGWGKATKDHTGNLQGSQSMIRNGKGRAGTAINTLIGYTDCGCNAGFEGGIVLDPFAGAGTTGVVAKKLNRNFIGIELNEKYIEMAKKRIENTQEILF